MLFTFSFMTTWFAIMFWTYEIRSSKWSSIMKLTVKPADWWSTNTGWCRSISCEEVSCCFLLYMLLYCIFQVLRFYYFEKSFYSISSEFNRYFCILGKGFIQVTDTVSAIQVTYWRTTLCNESRNWNLEIRFDNHFLLGFIITISLIVLAMSREKVKSYWSDHYVIIMQYWRHNQVWI